MAMPMGEQAEAAKPAGRTPTEQAAHINEVFSAEITDAEWATETSATLEVELRKRAPSGFAFRSIACRTTLCKAEIALPDEGTYQSFVEAALAAPVLWEGALLAMRKKDQDTPNAVSGVMFFARPGRDMPYLTN